MISRKTDTVRIDRFLTDPKVVGKIISRRLQMIQMDAGNALKQYSDSFVRILVETEDLASQNNSKICDFACI